MVCCGPFPGQFLRSAMLSYPVARYAPGTFRDPLSCLALSSPAAQYAPGIFRDPLSCPALSSPAARCAPGTVRGPLSRPALSFSACPLVKDILVPGSQISASGPVAGRSARSFSCHGMRHLFYDQGHAAIDASLNHRHGAGENTGPCHNPHKYDGRTSRTSTMRTVRTL